MERGKNLDNAGWVSKYYLPAPKVPSVNECNQPQCGLIILGEYVSMDVPVSCLVREGGK
jgi:hypothetical protein